MDELYAGPFCVRASVDNRRFKRLLCEVLDHAPAHAHIEKLFVRHREKPRPAPRRPRQEQRRGPRDAGPARAQAAQAKSGAQGFRAAFAALRPVARAEMMKRI